MLACVCQPADPGIFRRSPIPLGAPPLKIANRGAIPKPGRIIRLYPPTSTIVPSSEVDDGKTKCDDGVKNEPKQTEKAEGREEISTLVNAHCDKKSKRRAKRIDELPEGVQLTLNELREMACRQQAQIDSQHQLLAAKEQRLRYLKEQEARQQRVHAESERLRRLRDRVDAQELKLRKLRALRGQVDHQKQNNISLTSDLDSIRALFNEKEKELSLAVAKVEELTRQLEELRRGRTNRDPPPPSALELEKLRRELMYRNKLNEQQNQRLHQQREALTARQEEMSAIDKRISELQERLHKKRILNQQLANQISAASHKAAYHQLVRLTGSSDQNNQAFSRKPQSQPTNGLSRGNIAAVEPYNHVPMQSNHQIRLANSNAQEQPNLAYHPVYHQSNHIKKDADSPNSNQDAVDLANKMANLYSQKNDDNDVLKDFSVSKSDPKYQTLPYNTKFTVNLLPNRISKPEINAESKENDNSNISNHINGNMQSTHMTVHSAPLNVINKNIATPLNQHNLLSKKTSDQSSISNGNGLDDKQKENYPVTTSNSFNTYQKPISSVAPTSIQHTGILSNIYQTSSIKVQPVEPQTINSNKQPPAVPLPNNSQQSLILSPPQSTSTPLSTPEVSLDKISKPALPPKPAIKPPPRQTQSVLDQDNAPPPPLPLTEPPDEELQNPEKNDSDNSPTEPKDNKDETDRSSIEDADLKTKDDKSFDGVIRRCKKGNLKQTGKSNLSRRVSFDPLALLLDASLEGELELVKKTATQVPNPSAANDEGITALHNAICAGHIEIVKFLVEFGCDVNAQDSDGWTPLHCAASCNNLTMVKFLVEHGACIFATTLSDHETAAEKCEEDEEGFDGCSEYLYSVQEKLGILSGGVVYAVFDYTAQQPDELSFKAGQQFTILRKGDENEREWWWSRLGDKEGYVPRNLLGLYPRVNRSEE
ncbi:apoptosis-stimulating of p53 protein 2 isoform X5 [Aethina tumida]|uniref:apoptosis-stimulating of p53 protein 2 isoform X5 n=1 Tax=Aethina tumida TaxID=116153 RepID=UPI0021479C6B|nr:apoptosis-stimulating of p53 protein 2 isoform X5 [Aethina tumida]